MTDKPLVSAVIVSYNRRDDLMETIRMLQRQHYENLEIIIVDNASADGSAAMAAGLNLTNLTLIQMAENVGVKAYNAGFEAARGQFILILDDDSFPAPDAIEKMIERFASYPSIGIISFTVKDYSTFKDSPAATVSGVEDTSFEEILKKLKDNAAPFKKLELTPETWKNEFGENRTVKTPEGDVFIGMNQYLKLKTKDKGNRGKYFGLIKPTLADPSYVVEVKAPKEGAERDTKKIFIKPFKSKDGNTYFMSVTIQQGGKEISITSHPKDAKDLIGIIKKGEVLYSKSAPVLQPAASRPQEHPTSAGGHLDGSTIPQNTETIKLENETDKKGKTETQTAGLSDKAEAKTETPSFDVRLSKNVDEGAFNDDYIMSFHGAGAGVRREVIEKAGGYPEEFFLYFNETDMAMRVCNAGYRIESFPDIICFHKSAQTNRTSERGPFYYTRNIFWVIWKNFPGLLMWKATCLMVFYVFYYSLEQRTWIYIRALLDAVINVSKITRSPIRKEIAKRFRMHFKTPFTMYR
ncbi:MAG: glycosyltransferase [Candidatus Magnetominusculus sp. LBB02]|nr:glycosyltransferase [Candidatus Magnetominusculus sp. LBB02]